MFYAGYRTHREKTTEQLKSDLQYAQWERDRLQEQADAAQQREEERRDQRRRESSERYESDLKQADDWPEALRNQIVLFGREADLEARDKDPHMYFTKGVAACRRALEIWEEEETGIEDQVAELQRQLNALRSDLRIKVADRLEAENPDFASVAGALKHCGADGGPVLRVARAL
jgi:hypothetical protein